jgi:hypothetical protein
MEKSCVKDIEGIDRWGEWSYIRKSELQGMSGDLELQTQVMGD